MYNKEQTLISMYYDPNTPVDNVFSAVNKFRDLYILTEQPKSDGLLTNIAYIIFNMPRFFMESLKQWNRKDLVAKIYVRSVQTQHQKGVK